MIQLIESLLHLTRTPTGSLCVCERHKGSEKAALYDEQLEFVEGRRRVVSPTYHYNIMYTIANSIKLFNSTTWSITSCDVFKNSRFSLCDA